MPFKHRRKNHIDGEHLHESSMHVDVLKSGHQRLPKAKGDCYEDRD
jgi:hypothetical protein